MKKIKIPLTRVIIEEQELELVRETLQSGWIAQGPRVEEFETKFARAVGAEQAVAVSSCTAGLFLSLHLLGVGPGAEVIVPSYSFIATANAVVHCGATPVFADIDPSTYNIAPGAIQAALSKKTAAIIPVHQVGQAADLDRIYEIAGRHGLPVVEDAACAIGTRYKGKPVGEGTEFACFSFHPRKILSTGEGGMITTNSAETAQMLKVLRHQGMSISDLARHKSRKVIFEQYPVVGFNFRMTDIQAALGIAQLARLECLLAARAALAERYTRAFSVVPHLSTPYVPDYSGHSFQSYILRLEPGCPVSRDKLMQELLDRGISTRRGIMCSHLEPCYANLGRRTDLGHSEKALLETLVIPLFPGMSEAEQGYVIDNIIELTGGN